MLTWDGGRAEVDYDTGRVCAIMRESQTVSTSNSILGTAELDVAAIHIAELLGWDRATLAASGFTPGEAEIVPRGDAPTEYRKRWEGHDGGDYPMGA